ncbi:MAG: hypothetical protein V2I33_11615 [Kangiellaceae bacterium]|nr:hypothetical protein [Kangiellaceae bacterium]
MTAKVPSSVKGESWYTLYYIDDEKLEAQLTLNQITELVNHFSGTSWKSSFFASKLANVLIDGREIRTNIEVVNETALKSIDTLGKELDSLNNNEVYLSRKLIDLNNFPQVPMTVDICGRTYVVKGLMPSQFSGFGANDIGIWTNYHNAKEVFACELDYSLANIVLKNWPLFHFAVHGDNADTLFSDNNIDVGEFRYKPTHGIITNIQQRSKHKKVGYTLAVLVNILLILVIATDVMMYFRSQSKLKGYYSLINALGAVRLDIIKLIALYQLLPRAIIILFSYYISTELFQEINKRLYEFSVPENLVKFGSSLAALYLASVAIVYIGLLLLLVNSVLRDIMGNLTKLRVTTVDNKSRNWLLVSKVQLYFSSLMILVTIVLGLQIIRISDIDYGYKITGINILTVKNNGSSLVNINTYAKINSTLSILHSNLRSGSNSIAFTSVTPMRRPYRYSDVLSLNGLPTEKKVSSIITSDNFFELMGIEIVAGRLPRNTDELLVNSSFKTNICRCESVVNNAITIKNMGKNKTIVGEVSDTRYFSPYNTDPTIYSVSASPIGALLVDTTKFIDYELIVNNTDYDKTTLAIDRSESVQSLIYDITRLDRVSLIFSIFITIIFMGTTFLSVSLGFKNWLDANKWLISVKVIFGATKDDLFKEFIDEVILPYADIGFILLPSATTLFFYLSLAHDEVSLTDIWIIVISIALPLILVMILFFYTKKMVSNVHAEEVLRVF